MLICYCLALLQRAGHVYYSLVARATETEGFVAETAHERPVNKHVDQL